MKKSVLIGVSALALLSSALAHQQPALEVDTRPSAITRPVVAQVGQAATAVTTRVVADQISARLSEAINRAQDAGNFLLAKALMSAKEVIDSWKKANEELLDKAFDRLDTTQRGIFDNARVLLEVGADKVDDALKKSQEIVETVDQAISNLPITDKRSYVTRLMTRVVPPNAAQGFRIRIRGRNLDTADVQLRLSKGNAKRDVIGPLEVQFEIPISEIPSDPSKLGVRTFKIAFHTVSSNWFKRLAGIKDTVERELPLIVLPKTLATFEVSSTYLVDVRQEQAFTRDLGQFRGRNERVYRVANPEPGWKWDLSKPLSLIQREGEAGRCEGIDMNQSEPMNGNGVVMFAHLDEIRRIFTSDPGYVSCSLAGTLFRIVTEPRSEAPKNGDLSWTADVQVALPDRLTSFTLKMKLFDGRERIVTGPMADSYFEVRQEPGRLIISPRLPSDIMN